MLIGPGSIRLRLGGEIAAATVDATGIAPYGDEQACRWVAVRHAPDHIHITGTLARIDGRRQPRLRRDLLAVHTVARAFETLWGLTPMSPQDRTAVGRPSTAELAKETGAACWRVPARPCSAPYARRPRSPSTTPTSAYGRASPPAVGSADRSAEARLVREAAVLPGRSGRAEGAGEVAALGDLLVAAAHAPAAVRDRIAAADAFERAGRAPEERSLEERAQAGWGASARTSERTRAPPGAAAP
ncbi:hypothetical protein WDV06_19970 [Streptomyces racemochromogenes]|uniref:Relaxase domain-containing protein n=1 Tax=Streptomyces racemochromogenes TaxID=67353 RepID=A0ABW7PGA9_9ACTN